MAGWWVFCLYSGEAQALERVCMRRGENSLAFRAGRSVPGIAHSRHSENAVISCVFLWFCCWYNTTVSKVILAVL